MFVSYYVLNWLRNYEGRNDIFNITGCLQNMPFTKEDKILIKNLFGLKGYNAIHSVREFCQKKLKCQQRLQVVAIAMFYWLVDRRPAVVDDAVPALILLTNWCYTKMASQEIIIICILYIIIWSYCVQNIIKIGWWVLKIKQIKAVSFWAWLKRPIFGVYDSQCSAETLVMRGGITNYRLIAYSFSNISAKNYQNRLMCIEVIVCNVSVVFLRHSVQYCRDNNDDHNQSPRGLSRVGLHITWSIIC